MIPGPRLRPIVDRRARRRSLPALLIPGLLLLLLLPSCGVDDERDAPGELTGRWYVKAEHLTAMMWDPSTVFCLDLVQSGDRLSGTYGIGPGSEPLTISLAGDSVVFLGVRRLVEFRGRLHGGEGGGICHFLGEGWHGETWVASKLPASGVWEGVALGLEDGPPVRDIEFTLWTLVSADSVAGVFIARDESPPDQLLYDGRLEEGELRFHTPLDNRRVEFQGSLEGDSVSGTWVRRQVRPDASGGSTWVAHRVR